MGKMEFLPLHKHKHYTDKCVEMLNEEWPRSKGARLHTLRKSSDSFPYCIVMVEMSAVGTGRVRGYSRLSRVHGKDDACFVESVIVSKSLRGKGFGRILMEGTEDVAKRLGFKTCYLTTHDKQGFYKRVGYTDCEPIVSLGAASNLLSSQQLSKLLGPMKNETSVDSKKPCNIQNSQHEHLKECPSLAQSALVNGTPPPPAPPPPPPPARASKAPPPPPPPPLCTPTGNTPPPPPPPTLPSGTNNNLPIRLDPSQVSWMKKELVCD